MAEALEADYVIVGGGSAGCVLANRLSADPKIQVILIEAGGEGDSFLVQMPVGMAKLINSEKADWRYSSEVDPSIAGRRFVWSAGKLLGGSSSINGQVYIRGLRSDYDRWVAEGCAGWSFDEVLPYFKRGERYEGATPLASHGTDGELSVSPMRKSEHPLTGAFLSACAASGLPTLDDYCGGEQHGAFRTLATQRDGLRCSSAKAFLAPVRQRPNLRVLTNTEAEKIIVAQNRASGVRVRRGGQQQEVRARAEVLISAGVIGSPALLLRSGIGPAAPLQALGISVQRDLAGVGRNLQEHPCAGISKWVNVPTFNSLNALQLGGEMLRFLFKREGMMTTAAVQAMGFIKTLPTLADPDVQLHFLPLTYEVTPQTVCSASAVMPKRPAMLINFNVCRPYSRGELRLRSADPQDKPIIDHQLLGDARDLQTLVRAARQVEALFATPGLREYVVADAAPETKPASDEQWADYLRHKTLVNYHPVGTCRMGTDDAAVVDPQLRLRGIDRLRVIDASVMPSAPSANTNAPTMMIAEKAAAMLAAR